MAIAFVNGVAESAGASATTKAAAAQNHTTGNTIIVFVSNYTSPVRTVTSVADTALNSYTKAGGDYGGDASNNIECWVATNITGHASNVVTATFNAAATFRVIGVIQYSGLHTTSPYDASAAGSRETGTTLTSDPVTTTSDDQIALAFWIAWDETANCSSSGSSTLRVTEGVELDNSCITERVAATAGPYTVAVNLTISREYAVIVRSFKAEADDEPEPSTDGTIHARTYVMD